MKKLTVLWFFCLFTFAFCLASYAGQWTAHGYFYKPSMGASGQTEYNLFNQGLDQADAELFALDPPPGLIAIPPLTYNAANGVISLPQASARVSGYLASGDWSAFNAKEPAISLGTSLQYWRGDKTWQTLNPAAVGAAPATAGTSILKGNGSGGTTAAVSNTDYAAVRDNGDPTYLWNGNKLLSRISDVWASITGGNLIVWGSNIYGTNLATIISTIGNSTPANLIVPTGTFAISANVTIPANIRLLPQKGATITIASGSTLTISGPFEAGLYQVFNDQNTSLNGVQFVTNAPLPDPYWPVDVPKPQHLWNFALSQDYSDHGTTGGLTLTAQGSGNSFGVNGLTFNGSGFASCANNADVCDLSSGAYSIIIELAPRMSSNWQGVVNGGGDGTGGWAIDCPSNVSSLQYFINPANGGGLQRGLSAITTLTANPDYQIIITYSGSGGQPSIYVNGFKTNLGNGFTVGIAGTGLFEIGTCYGSNNFNGTIKQLGVLKGTAWSSNQIYEIKNGKTVCPIEKVYPQWWGLTKNDVIIQSAINSLPAGGHVWIPDGDYAVAHGIASLGISNITIEGQSQDGTVLDSSGTILLTGTGGTAYSTAFPSTTPTLDPSSYWGTLFFDTDSTGSLIPSSVTVKNLTIKTCTADPGDEGGNQSNHHQFTVAVTNVSNFLMENCHIYCGFHEGVYVITEGQTPTDPLTNHNLAFIRNIFEGGKDIQLNPNTSVTSNFLVDGNTFLSPTFAIDTGCIGGRIINNYIYNARYGAITIDSVSNPTLIANNYIDGVGISGDSSQPIGIAGNAGSGADGILVIGNTVRRVYNNGTAIMASGNVTISNNKVSLAMENVGGGSGYGDFLPGPLGIGVLDLSTTSNIYLINNVIEATTQTSKWNAGIACGGTTNSPNSNIYVVGGIYNDILGAGNALKDVGNGSTTSANITIANAILNGPIVGAKGNIASLTPPANIPFSGNNLGTADSISGAKYLPTSLTAGATVAIAAGPSETFTLTPAQNETITVSGGNPGQDLYLSILTSGTSSYTLTFGTGFHSAGALATGTSSGAQFMIHFKKIAGTFVEVGRTGAM